jgi:hypothetical protein
MEPINTEHAKLFVDLDKPSLAGLSYVLRRPETWPNGFVWYYGTCDSCAIGLSCKLWRSFAIAWIKGRENFLQTAVVMSKIFRMPIGSALGIFVVAHSLRETKISLITPEMVADDIDAYLAREAAR